MNLRKLLTAFSLLACFLVQPAIAFGALGNPPVLNVDADRDGLFVNISGTVTDENVDTVSVSVIIGGGPASTIPVRVVNGKFDFDVEVSIGHDTITVIATDEENLTDTKIVDIAF